MKIPRVRRAVWLFCLCFLLGIFYTPAIAADTQDMELLSYEEAMVRLNTISLTDPDMLFLLNQSFQAAGAYRFAPQYKYLTGVLYNLFGPDAVDFAGDTAALLMLSQNSAFTADYTALDNLALLSPNALETYVQARRLEAQGNPEQAYQAYLASQILDSLDRAFALDLQQGSALSQTNMQAAATRRPGGGSLDAMIAATATVQPTEPLPTPPPPAVPWPAYHLVTYPLEPVLLEEAKRVMGYLGPSRNYAETDAFKPYKMQRTDGLFIEGNYVFVDMNYPTVGVRRVYFTRGVFRSTASVPEVSLIGYPATTTQSVSARYGPGMIYDPFPDADAETGHPLTVFFAESGYVFAEYQVGLEAVRAWIDERYVTPE